MAEPANPRVAVYIDFDNIVISHYDRTFKRGDFMKDSARNFRMSATGTEAIARRLDEARVDIGAILDYASAFGSIVISRAYADWSAPVNAAYQQQLVNRAVDLTQLFPVTSGMKNGADIRLAVDVVEDLFRLPDITHVVIVAGDSDYIALAQRAKRLGRTVIGIGVAGATSRSLMAACDEFSEYGDLPGVEPRPARPAKRQTKAEAAAAAAEAAAAGDGAPADADAGADAAAAPPAKGSGRRRRAVDPEPETADDPTHDQEAATRLLVRALQLVESRDSDQTWQFGGEVKKQMLRMDPAFKEKPLGFRSFTDFLESRADVVEVDPDAPGTGRGVRLRS
jgi:uncharacterized LabA/DUF88 family protein